VREIAEGAISWVCPLPYLRGVAVPAIEEGLRGQDDRRRRWSPTCPWSSLEDANAVREASRRQIGFYPRVPFYSQMFVDAGFPEAAAARCRTG
jgi:hypothetical protein